MRAVGKHCQGTRYEKYANSEAMFYQLVSEMQSRLDQALKEKKAIFAEKESLAEDLRASQKVNKYSAVPFLRSELLFVLACF